MPYFIPAWLLSRESFCFSEKEPTGPARTCGLAAPAAGAPGPSLLSLSSHHQLTNLQQLASLERIAGESRRAARRGIKMPLSFKTNNSLAGQNFPYFQLFYVLLA